MTANTDGAEVISMFIESVLYGLYVASFVCTIYVLIYKRSSQRVHYGMFSVTVLMFVLATTHLLINLIHLIDAFKQSQIYPGTARGLLEDFSSFKNLFRTCVILTEILVGDIILIYRCYVAWGRIRVIILPLILLFGSTGTSGGIVYSFTKTPRGSNIFQNEKLQSFIISTQVLVFMNNVICTCLLTWRLWRMSRAVLSREQRQGLRSVARIIAESGAITTLAWVTYITLNALHQPAAVILLNSLAPITAGAFCLIISRVALNKGIHKPPHDAIHHRGVPSADAPASLGGPCTAGCLCINPSSATTLQPPRRVRTRTRTPATTRTTAPTRTQPCTCVCTCPQSVLPVLDGTGRPHRPVEISVSSRESVRVEMSPIMEEVEVDDAYNDHVYHEKMSGLAGL